MEKDGAAGPADRLGAEDVSALEAILREGARKTLRTAVEAKAAAHIDAHRRVVDEGGIVWWSATARRPNRVR